MILLLKHSNNDNSMIKKLQILVFEEPPFVFSLA